MDYSLLLAVSKVEKEGAVLSTEQIHKMLDNRTFLNSTNIQTTEDNASGFESILKVRQ